MQFSVKLGIALVSALATISPAIAQSDETGPFDGGYLGLAIGYSKQRGDGGSQILFDRNLDGKFGDTIPTTTATNAPNAFSPGFCGGAAKTNAPAGGCSGDKDGYDIAFRAGGDGQFGHLVIGGLVEFGKTDIRDSVSAFAVTPDSYTLTRKISYNGRVAVRGGFALGNTLLYGMGGLSFARIRNSFATTNTVNRFTGNGDSGAQGYNFGGGLEHKFSPQFGVGIEYLFTDLKDDKFKLRVGKLATTPATNIFILGNQLGTDLARSDTHFRYQTVRLTFRYGF